MDTTGHVDPCGPSAIRRLRGLTVTKVSVGPMDNNAYLLTCPTTGRQLLIDAAAEPDRLLGVIGPSGLDTVVTTHRHGDHWQALAAVVAATGAVSLAHPADAAAVPGASGELREGDPVRVGDAELEVIHLPGHTPGSVALLYREPGGSAHLFSGDALFPGGPGRTTSPAAFASAMDALETRVFARLPDPTRFSPGHGDDGTLGAERPSLPAWRARGW